LSLIDIFDLPAEATQLSEVAWPDVICPTLPADPKSAGWFLVMPGADDRSSGRNIGFEFSLFGKSFTYMYVNNNGNLSFGKAYDEYTAEG
jgi:hypothetical protein